MHSPDEQEIRTSLPAPRGMKTVVGFTLLSTVFFPFVTAQASEGQTLEQVLLCCSRIEVEGSLSRCLRPVLESHYRRVLKRGVLIRNDHSAAKICCKNGNQDLEYRRRAGASVPHTNNSQQKFGAVHILAPTATSSSAFQVAPILTTS